MPNIAEMILAAGLVTQFIKKALAQIRVTITGKSAIILSVVCSVGIVAFYAVQTGTPFTLALIPIAIQVAVGANAGYSLLKVPRPKP